MQDQEYGQDQIDELIHVINNQGPNTTQLHFSDLQIKLLNDPKKQLPPLEQKLKLEGSLTIPLNKYLNFKPWSGIEYQSQSLINANTQPIREQIQNEDEDLHYEGQKQDFMQQSKILGTNTAATNEIGYFYRFNAGKVRLIKCLLDQNGFKDCNFNHKNWTVFWSCTPFKMQVYRALLPYQKVNHFPNSFHLTRKDLMNKTVSKMQVKYGIGHYNFLPKTYILPQQLDQLLSEHSRHPETTYIIKPHNRSQGKGIIVTNSMETISTKLQKYSSLIVSHYIGNPLLINRLKFDLRIYVAIIGINPLRIYVYEEGLARFATEEYDSTGYDSQNKRYQHLTNYSVNKKNTEYVASNNENQDYYGSKWRLTALKDFLIFNVGKSETNQLFERIDDVLVKTIISAENLLYTSFQNNVNYINGCFQVLGFDIMIDSNLKPWLIQVNHSPSMNTDSSLDLKIKGNMIADLFTLAGFTPLSERYLDGGHSRYESRHYFNVDERKGNQSAIDKFILKEVQMENQRKGSWRRIFPTIKNIKFKQYFEVDRYFNKLLRQKLLSQQTPTISDSQTLRNQYRSNTVVKSNSLGNQTNMRGNSNNIRLNKVKKGVLGNRASIQKISETSIRER